MMKSLILLFLISSLYAAPGPTSPRVLFFFDSTDPGIRYEAGWTDPGRFFPVFTIDNTWWSGAMFFDYGLNYDSPVSIGYNYLVTIQYTLILVDSNGNGAVVFGSNGITYMSTPFKDAVDFGQDLGNDLGPELKKTFNHNLITNDLFLHMVWFSYGTVPAPTAKGKKAAAATTNFPQAWGLQDVTITIYNCVEFCQVCNNNFRCIQCINGFYRRSWDDYDECIVCPLADPYCTFNQPIAYFEFQRKMNSSGFTGNQGYTPSITITTPQATAFGRVFGYFTTTSRFTKTFTGLHTHTFVAFDFDAVIVDQVIQGVDYLEVLVSGSPTVYRSNFQQSAGTTKSWSISTNFTHTGSSFTVTFQATLTHPLNKWGVGNLTFSMDKCMDPVALTCSFPYISNSCPVGYYLRTDSIHYITCQPCPTGYSNCQETSEDGHRYMTIYELVDGTNFNPATVGYNAPSHDVLNLTSDKWFCSGNQFYGPFGPNDYLTRTYTGLSSLKRFRWKFSFKLYRLDNWTGEAVSVLLGAGTGGTQLFTRSFVENDTNSDYYCEDYYNVSMLDNSYPIDINWTYSKETTNPAFTIKSNLAVDSWVLASWGISDVTITLEICVDTYCLSCDNNTHCAQCQDGFYRSGFRCFKSCPPATFPDNVNKICPDCIPGCEVCTNSTNCRTCLLGYAWNGTACTPICQLGYWVYNATRTCQPCPSRCIECRAPNRCLSCTSTSYFSFGYCLGYCPEGYYKNDSLPIKTCGVCPKPCFGCGTPDSNNCTSCFFGQYLLNTSCVDDCKPYGLVNDLVRRRCGVCFTGCVLCNGVGFDECYKCNGSYFLHEGQCIRACPASFYPNPNPENRTCEPCDSSCYNCTGPNPTQCTACNGTFFYQNTCIDPCPDSYWPNSTDFTCRNCPSTCSLCTDPSNCLACKPNWWLQNRNCSYSCVGSFYRNNNTWQCEACNPQCETCFDVTSSSCLSCYSGNYYFSSNNTCLDSCPVKFFKGNKKCDSCPAQCKSCYSTDDCDACEDGYLLDTGKCQLSNCTSPCRTCSGPGETNCLSCNTGQYLQGSSCLDSCATGYIPTSSLINVCIKCTEGCTSCVDEYYLIADKCAPSCPSGMEPALLENVKICITQSRAPSISVVNAPSPTKKVYLSQDLTVQVEVSGTGGTPVTWWDTDGVPKPKKDQLFQGLNLNSTTLVIPKANLVSNTSYTLTIYAAVDTDVSSRTFKFTTVPDIIEGDFIVTPQEGLYLKDNFTITLTGWSHPGFTIYFDIYTYYQIYDPLPQQFLQQGMTALAVNLLNNPSGPTVVKFQIPPAEYNRTQYVQVIAHSESQSVTLTTSVKVSPLSGNDLKFIVEGIDSSQLKKPTDIINFGSAILKVYDITDSEKEATVAAVKVVENYAKLSNNPNFCMDDILCHSAGVCNVTNGARLCTCNDGYAGQYCEFNASTVQSAKSKIKLLIDVIVEYPLDNTTAGLVISCLQTLTIQPTFVNLPDLIKMLNRAQAVAQTDYVDKKIGSGMLEAMSNLFKAISANPTFKSQALSDVLRLIDTAADIITSKLGVGEAVRTVTDEMENQAISANNALDDVDNSGGGSTSKGGLRMLLKKVSSRRAPKRKNSDKKLKSTTGFTTSRGSSFKVPPISFQAKTSVSFAVQEFKSNQRDASNAGTMASSTTSLSIKDGNNPVTIDKLKDPIIIEIPKLSPTDPKKVKSKFKCSYYDRNTNKFKSDGCEKTGETTDTIICACKHLTEFGANVEIDPNDPPPQINLNNLFQSQASSLATRSRNPYTLTFFQQKYGTYINTIQRPEEPFSFVALFILAPLIAIAVGWFIKSFIRPIVIKGEEKKKVSSIVDILQYKQQLKSTQKHKHGVTAGALFSALTTTAESVKFPKHIRILCFWALMCSMMTFSAGISYALVKADVFTAASTVFTQKFAIIFASFVVIIVGNLAYDFCLGIIFYCLINKTGPISSQDTKRINKIRCLQYFTLLTEIIGCIAGTHLIVMINGTVTQYFPWIWLTASIIDFLIVDLAWWVLAVTWNNKCFRLLLQMRGFFIENFNQFKYEDIEDDDPKKDEGTSLTEKDDMLSDSIFDENSAKQFSSSEQRKKVDPNAVDLAVVSDNEGPSKMKIEPELDKTPKDITGEESKPPEKYKDASFMKNE